MERSNYSFTKEVHFVVDTYRKDSIKNAERGRRSVGGSLRTKIDSADQQGPQQWKKFLACGENKAELIRFFLFFQTWRKKPAECLKKVKVLVAHDGECHEFTDENEQMIVRSVPQLECNHE